MKNPYVLIEGFGDFGTKKLTTFFEILQAYVPDRSHADYSFPFFQDAFAWFLSEQRIALPCFLQLNFL